MEDESRDLARLALDELAAVLGRVDEAAMDHACRMITEAGRTGVFGCGREALQIKGFAMRLFHLGLPVAVVGDVTMPPLGPGDLFLVTAGPGELATVLLRLRYRDRGADGSSIDEPSVLALVFRRRDGRWLLVQDQNTPIRSR